MNDYLKSIKERLNCFGRYFNLEKIKGMILMMGCECVDTNGLPFNGSTYAIYATKVIGGRPYKILVGHFKYVYQIYSKEVNFTLFDETCLGGEHLNEDEINRFCYERMFIRS